MLQYRTDLAMEAHELLCAQSSSCASMARSVRYWSMLSPSFY